MRLQTFSLVALVAVFAGCASPPSSLPVPAHAVIGVNEQHLDVEHWIERAGASQRLVLDEASIESQNARLAANDASFHNLEDLPDQLTQHYVRAHVEKLSVRPAGELFDESGRVIATETIEAALANVAFDSIPATQATRYGMVVKRANLRTLPTNLRVFRTNDDADIDRFQESALFPATPVVIAHTSRDGRWFFVVSGQYAAWIEKRFVAEGAAEEIFAYARREPYVIVTGATARTVFTRERPELSELQLEMGVRVPLIANWPADRLVNGQHPYTSHVVELPWREASGALRFGPALLPRTADVSSEYLPMTRANILRQSFKFLGERYGWGHAYNARDCSGFVSEVYRSFGAQLPRNTRDQAMSPVLERLTFGPDDTPAERTSVLQQLEIGDLVYIPGHVMMVIGHDNGVPYVIHDTTGINYRDADGEIRRVTLNGVSVTPLTPLLGGDRPIAERVYSIVLMRHR